MFEVEFPLRDRFGLVDMTGDVSVVVKYCQYARIKGMRTVMKADRMSVPTFAKHQ